MKLMWQVNGCHWVYSVPFSSYNFTLGIPVSLLFRKLTWLIGWLVGRSDGRTDWQTDRPTKWSTNPDFLIHSIFLSVRILKLL